MAGSERSQAPTTLSSALRRYVARIDKNGKLDEASVIEQWSLVVGDNILQHTDVVGLRKGELLVAVDSNAWATELTAMADQLRASMNERSGREMVKAVRFTVSQRVEHRAAEDSALGRTERRYGGERVEPVELSADERAAIDRSVEAIQDEDLREAARQATIRDLEWKKGLEAPKSPQSETGGVTGPKTGRKP